jgi:hypothetical protein
MNLFDWLKQKRSSLPRTFCLPSAASWYATEITRTIAEGFSSLLQNEYVHLIGPWTFELFCCAYLYRKDAAWMVRELVNAQANGKHSHHVPPSSQFLRLKPIYFEPIFCCIFINYISRVWFKGSDGGSRPWASRKKE